jgi:hypothetical protein
VIEVFIIDDGVGVFQKLKEALGYQDERQGVLELAKGKLTTDPERHSGQGIFFTSRACDSFSLMSGRTALVTGSEDWALETSENVTKGTMVVMKVKLDTDRELLDVFNKYADAEAEGFDRTNVPVALAKYGADELVSRSQAKRILARFEKFKEVTLDFKGVNTIGQAFADEIFRVFARMHPEVHLTVVNANARVQRFIKMALQTAAEQAAT